MNTKTTAEKTNKGNARVRLSSSKGNTNTKTTAENKPMNASEKLIQEIAPLAQANDKATKAHAKAQAARNAKVNTARSRIEAKQQSAEQDAHVIAYRAHVAECNARKDTAKSDARIVGAETVRQIQAGEFTVSKSLIPYDPLGKRDINPVAGLTNVNPFHDAHQQVYEQKEYTTGNVVKTVRRIRSASGAKIAWGVSAEIVRTEKTNSYPQWSMSKAKGYAARYIAESHTHGMDLEFMRNQLTDAALSGISHAITSITTNDTLTHELLARLAINVAPEWIQKRIAKYALQGCDRLRRHMAINRPTETSYFDGYDSEFVVATPYIEYAWQAPEHASADDREERMDTLETMRQTNAEKLRKVNERCDKLDTRVSEMLARATSNRERGHLKSVSKLIARAREWATASIDSRVFKFRTPLTFHAEHETVTQSFKCGKGSAKDRTFKMSTGKVVTQNALHARSIKLAQTLGIYIA